MAFAGGLQIALERFEAFVELLQIRFEFVLTAVGNRQHQRRQIVEDRDQFVPVQAMFEPLAHGFGLWAMSFGQGQVVEQADQRVFDVFGHGAVGRLRGIRQGEEDVVLGLLRIDRRQCLSDGRGQGQGVEEQRLWIAGVDQFVGVEGDR